MALEVRLFLLVALLAGLVKKDEDWSCLSRRLRVGLSIAVLDREKQARKRIAEDF